MIKTEKEKETKFKYKDPTAINRRLDILLKAYIVVHLVLLLFTIYETYLLSNSSSLAEFEQDHTLFNAMFSAIGLVMIPVLVFIPFSFLQWQYRAVANLIAVGKNGIQILPGWSIGFYFVPILNLIRPYQSIKEIWIGYQFLELRTIHGQGFEAPSIFRWWWGFWLLSRISDNISQLILEEADTLQKIIDGNYYFIFEEIFLAILGLLALSIISPIQEKQAELNKLREWHQEDAIYDMYDAEKKIDAS